MGSRFAGSNMKLASASSPHDQASEWGIRICKGLWQRGQLMALW